MYQLGLGLSIFLFCITMFFYLKKELQILQQNSYRNNRYLNYYGKKERKAGQLFLFLVSFLAIFNQDVLVAVLILMFTILFLKRPAKGGKKPLVVTNRVKRIAYANGGLLALIVGIYLFLMLAPLKLGIFFGSLVVVSGFLGRRFIMLVANMILIPLEKNINRKFLDEAKDILKSMPSLKVIGITGSYGKTSTKHILEKILSEEYMVLMTPGSFNTPLGVTRVIRESLKPIHEVFIVEMGAKQVGDIRELCALAEPDYGILTAVGEQHLETFGSLEQIIKTKFELVDYLSDKKQVLLNFDDANISSQQENFPVNAVGYAIKNEQAAYHCKNLLFEKTGMRFDVYGPSGHLAQFETRLLGKHNMYNILAAVALADSLQVAPAKMKKAVKALQPVEHRLSIKTTPEGFVLIDDAFNSNPVGAEMALEVIRYMAGGRRHVITPGMVELGDKEAYYNQIFGRQMAKAADEIYLVGEQRAALMLKGLEEVDFSKDHIHVCSNFLEAYRLMQTKAVKDDIVLLENDLPDIYE